MIFSDVSRATAIGTMGVAVVAGAPSLVVYALAVLATIAVTPFAPAQARCCPISPARRSS